MLKSHFIWKKELKKHQTYSEGYEEGKWGIKDEVRLRFYLKFEIMLIFNDAQNRSSKN